MSPRPKAVTDQQLFRAVARAVARVGPADLTLAEVAAEAGISAPSIVQRFGSKRGLLLAFAAQAGSGLGERFDSAREGNSSPLDALREALVSLTGQLRGARAMANNLAFLQMDVSDDEFRAHAVEFAVELRTQIQRLLEEAVAQRELNPRTSSVRMAKAVHTMYNGALVTWAMEREGTLREAIAEGLELLLRPFRYG